MVSLRGMKVLSVGLLAVLLTSVIAVAPAFAVPGGDEIKISNTPDYTVISTDYYTVIFPRDTKPMFIYWNNDQPEKAYVVHFKGLVEYATIDGSDFSLYNLSESTLFTNLIQHMNQVDQLLMGRSEKVAGDILKASDAILEAMEEQGLGHNKSGVMAKLLTALAFIQGLDRNFEDEDLQGAIDAALAAVEGAIVAVQAGESPGKALNDARKAVADVLKAAADSLMETIEGRIEARGNLLERAKDFHPAILPFNSANWTIGEITPIDGGGDPIGFSFTMTLTQAPKKFEFAEDHVSMAIRIYNSSVVENNELYGQTITYEVGNGEMKMDLTISNWDWNFEPETILALDSEGISITPGLALWVDSSCFNASGVEPEVFFNDLDDVMEQPMVSKVSFASDGAEQFIQMNEEGIDAKALKFKPKINSVRIAGKSFGMAAANEVTYDNSTLGGFFKFVQYAFRVNATEGTAEVVPVSASYFAHGNHLRVYITYPYFSDTLIHDPSIGVRQQTDRGPSYIVDVGAAGVAEIQALPIFLSYPTLMGAAMAAILALGGAVLFMIFVRRHPTFT